MWQCVLVAVLALHVGVAHSWDIAVGVGDQLIFYNTDGTKIYTIHSESQNLAALAYDDVHNMILYVDKQSDNDAIGGYNLVSMKFKYLIERNGRNIQGLAYDPATEKLFFTDTKEKSVNWISLKPGFKNNVYGNLLLKLGEGIPTDIAVDSCKGYIYWITTNLVVPVIERARYDGSDREVIIYPNSNNGMEPHSLVIDQQTQKMFWVEPVSKSLYRTYRADLNGNGKRGNSFFNLYNDEFTSKSNVLTVSNNSLISWKWSTNSIVYEEPKLNNNDDYRYLFSLQNKIPISIVANYKIEQQTQGLQDCETLTSLVREIATEYEGPFCVHGMKGKGHSRCKCEPGYTGELCDVSVCENYCMQGDCSFNDEGHPTCSCKVGYTGERCEVSECHGYCLNDGDCYLNQNSAPVCQCKANYVGDRCEVSDCRNYCIHGNCSSSDGGRPTCSCNAGYSGERCEVSACLGHCQNHGTCSLNVNNKPVCQCRTGYAGDSCEITDCLNYCIKGNCSFSDEGHPSCSCNAGYTGERCEVTKCHGYCLNDGDCSLNEEDEPVCQCVANYEGSRCEIDKNNTCTIINTPTFYSAAQKNLTLADLLSNWQKRTARISVTVEV